MKLHFLHWRSFIWRRKESFRHFKKATVSPLVKRPILLQLACGASLALVMSGTVFLTACGGGSSSTAMPIPGNSPISSANPTNVTLTGVQSASNTPDMTMSAFAQTQRRIQLGPVTPQHYPSKPQPPIPPRR